MFQSLLQPDRVPDFLPPIRQIVRVDDEIEIKAYYAGHVLGAAMFHVRVGNQASLFSFLIINEICPTLNAHVLLFPEPGVHRRLQHDPRPSPGRRLDRQVQARPAHHRVHLRHHHQGLQALQGARLSEKGSSLLSILSM